MNAAAASLVGIPVSHNGLAVRSEVIDPPRKVAAGQQKLMVHPESRCRVAKGVTLGRIIHRLNVSLGVLEQQLRCLPAPCGMPRGTSEDQPLPPSLRGSGAYI